MATGLWVRPIPAVKPEGCVNSVRGWDVRIRRRVVGPVPLNSEELVLVLVVPLSGVPLPAPTCGFVVAPRHSRSWRSSCSDTSSPYCGVRHGARS